MEMNMTIFAEFENRIKNILQDSNIKEKNGKCLDLSCISVDVPRDTSHGDIATNAAMVLARAVGKNPRSLAVQISALLGNDSDIASVEIAGPGFINLRLTDIFWHTRLANMIKQGVDYGRSNIGKNVKVNIEYVSANPTGPLHIGHCRGAVVGDVLANLLNFAGYDVVKEYYINDAGGQVKTLARSVFLRYREALGQNIGTIPEGLYPGDYLVPVGKALVDEFGEALLKMDRDKALSIARVRATAAMMRLIRRDLAALNVHHDVFFSEHTLHADHGKAIRSVIDDLTLRGYIYKGKLPPPKGHFLEDWEERDQVLLRSTEVGDDMDRPLIKSDGSYTYFAADLAYFKNKYDRGFNEMIYVLGADHSGYVKRLEAIAKSISGAKARPVVLLCQLVKLYRDGKLLHMGKRTGNFITLRNVIDEVGCDPIRFMMLYRKSDAPLDFDFIKVTEQSKDNPVFYVQYASARCHSVLRQACESLQINEIFREDMLEHIGRLSDESELTLIRKLAEYPRLIEQAAMHQEPHRLIFYLYELAGYFHSHWNKGHKDASLRFVQVADKGLTYARLGLIQVIADIFASGLGIIGVKAPTEMR
ncbi:MAG: arginyl-tRNA synthetase [Candidatus Tokpelaia sp. JSC188]|nr:MAG: arginyl-tRNA synthetase [Candidatus Tokpelaia sp. JSC188]